MMNDKFYQSVIENSPIGYAYHQIIYSDKGILKDYELIETNIAFEKIIGIKSKQLIGKKISDITTKIDKKQLSWGGLYRDITNNKTKEEDEYHFESRTNIIASAHIILKKIN